MQIDQRCKWTNRPNCRHRGPCVKEGAPVTRPVGVLDPAPPKGCSCVEFMTDSCKSPNPRSRPGRTTVRTIWSVLALFWSNLVQLGRLVRHVRPSCSTWLLLGSNLAHLCSNLAQLSANLAQLGSILAHLGSNLVPFWSQLGPTWFQNLTKMSFKSGFLATPSDVQFCIDFCHHVGSIL